MGGECCSVCDLWVTWLLLEGGGGAGHTCLECGWQIGDYSSYGRFAMVDTVKIVLGLLPAVFRYVLGNLLTNLNCFDHEL